MPATATTPKTSRPAAPTAATLLTPSLVCRDAAGAIEFYKRAFGAEEMRVIRSPDGRVMHAALTVGGAMIFLGEECVEFGSRSPQTLGGSPVTLSLHVSDCDAVFARAVTAGCTVRMPPADMFWGDRFGVLSDPYGHLWSVATNVRKLTDEEIQKAAAAAATQMQSELERRRAAGQ
jgi:PhnB protein